MKNLVKIKIFPILVLGFMALSPVIAMNKRTVDLSGQNISDITTLEFPDDTLTINLSNNQLVTLVGGKFPESLAALVVDENNLDSLSGLPNALRFLSVDNNGLDNIVGDIPLSLESFFAQNNSLTSIENLVNNINLDKIVVNNNQITDISVIQNLQNLTDIEFDDNNVTDINFPWPKTVEDINFSNNAIEDISPLTEITALEDIFAIGGEVQTLPDFSQLNNLRDITLPNHQITEFNCGFIPSSVRDVSLRNNGLSNVISPCEMTLPKLKELNLASNNLTEINMTLRRARKLRTIDLSSNNLTSLENLTIKPRRASFKLDVRDNGNLPQSEIKAFKKRHPNARVKSGGFF